MLPDILHKATAAHLAIDVSRAALEAAHQKAQMMFAVGGPVMNANQGMEMVRHQHRFKDLKLGILFRQPLPIFPDLPPKLVQDDLVAHNRPKHRLVVRDLARHEEPAATIVDVRVPKRLAKQMFIALSIGAAGLIRPHAPFIGAAGLIRPHVPFIGAAGLIRRPHAPFIGAAGLIRPHAFSIGAAGLIRPHVPFIGAAGFSPQNLLIAIPHHQSLSLAGGVTLRLECLRASSTPNSAISALIWR